MKQGGLWVNNNCWSNWWVQWNHCFSTFIRLTFSTAKSYQHFNKSIKQRDLPQTRVSTWQGLRLSSFPMSLSQFWAQRAAKSKYIINEVLKQGMTRGPSRFVEKRNGISARHMKGFLVNIRELSLGGRKGVNAVLSGA